MNIGNNLGMALLTSGSDGVASAGGMQGILNGSSGASGTGCSLFQQLIAQLMPANYSAAGAVSLNQEVGSQGKSAQPNDFLAELVLAGGGNLAKLRIQTTLGMAEGQGLDAGQPEKSMDENEKSDLMDSIQALFAGMNNGAAGLILQQLSQKSPGSEKDATAAGNIQSAAANAGIAGKPNDMPKQTEAVWKNGLAAAEAITVEKEAVSVVPDNKSVNFKDVIINGTNNISENQKLDGVKTVSDQELKQSSTASAAGREMKEVSKTDGEAKQQAEVSLTDGADIRGALYHIPSAAETASVSQPVQTNEHAEAYTQIKDEILTKLEQKGPSEFSMQLEPADLGQIDIKLKLSEGKLVIDIMAANSKTQALLTSQVDKLISGMGLQNVQVESVQVSQQMNSQTQDNSQNQGYSMNAAMDFSQRKQQEHNQQQFFNNDVRQNRAFGFVQGENLTDNQVSSIESLRYDPHRMNYAV